MCDDVVNGPLVERMRWVCGELFSRPVAWKRQWSGLADGGYGAHDDYEWFTAGAEARVWPEGIAELRDTWLDWLAATARFCGDGHLLEVRHHEHTRRPLTVALPLGTVLWSDATAAEVRVALVDTEVSFADGPPLFTAWARPAHHRAGTPTAVTPAGTSPSTTAPAPTLAPSPR